MCTPLAIPKNKHEVGSLCSNVAESFIFYTYNYRRLHVRNKNGSNCSIIRTIIIIKPSARVFLVTTWYHNGATFTKLEWLVHRILSFQSAHATLVTYTKLEWLVHRILSFTVRTQTLATYTKLEWLVHRILLSTAHTRDTRNVYIDYCPV